MKKYYSSIGINKLLFVVILLSLIYQFFTGLFQDFLPDDAYYYLQTAINNVKHGFYSMDGEHETNGFHPLWAWTLSLFYSIVGVSYSVETIYVLFLSMNFVLLFIISNFLYYSLNKEKDPQVRLSYLAIYTSLAILLSIKGQLFFNGMETSMALLFMILFLHYFRYKKWVWSGIAALLLVLSRLDMLVFFLIPFLLLYIIFFKIKIVNYWKEAIMIFLPVFIGLLLYLGYNYFHFGHISPINGTLRSTFPFPNFQIYLLNGNYLFIIEFFLLLSLFLSMLIPKKRRNSTYKIGMIFMSLVIITLLNFILFQKWSKPIATWYLSIPALFSIVIAIIFIGIRLQAKIFNMGIGLGIFLLLAFNIVNITYKAYKYGNNSILSDLHKGSSIEYAKTLPLSSRFASTDSGTFTFWTERYTTNLDGLINNHEYQDDLKFNSLQLYLNKNKIDYIVENIWENPQIMNREYEPMYKNRANKKAFDGNYEIFNFYVYSYKYNQYSDTIQLKKCSEIWRSVVRKDGSSRGISAIFDLNKNKNCSNH